MKRKKNEMALIACEKIFQEAMEILMDICAMLMKNMGSNIKDDYSNIEILKEKKVFEEKEAEILKEANGLRNVLVHRYNSIDKERFLESSIRLKERLKEIIKKLRNL